MSHAGLKLTDLWKTRRFNGGEIQVEKCEASSYVDFGYGNNVIDIRTFTDDNNIVDMMGLAQAKDINDFIGIETDFHMMYCPFSRQDRRMASENYVGSHALKVFADFINGLNFRSVVTFDPHSDVVEALFNNVKIISNNEIVYDAVEKLELGDDIGLISPDVGASKKIFNIANMLTNKGKNVRIHQCEKIRDVGTGQIVKSVVPQSLEILITGTDVILVDDICDGGRSFVEIAKLVEHLNLHLIVSHGIFSQGYRVLLDHFDTIHTTDSFSQKENNNVFTTKI